jgi:SAM-dependent methyltransferase
MDLAAFEHLLTPAGAAALLAAAELSPTEATFLPCYETLRKRFPADLAKAAAETVILRRKAADRFPHADRMFFTREALEQASSAPVSAHRAGRFRPFGVVADLCCGVGADAITLAAAGGRVEAIDRDPLRAAMAAANAAAVGAGDRVTVRVGNVLADPLPAADAAFCDPGRRADGRRFVAVRDYQPPPAAVMARLPAGFPVAFKLAPAVPWTDLDAFDGEAEFVSLGGELKECVLWLGPLRTARRRATVLPAGETLAADEPAAPPDVGPPGRIVYDPDPAVTRAGLVTDLAARLGASRPDPGGALLTADEPRPTPFATTYEVDVVLPFHLRRLAEVLRERGVGRVTVVKRGSGVDADELLRKLKLSGEEHRFVLLARIGRQETAIVGRRV